MSVLIWVFLMSGHVNDWFYATDIQWYVHVEKVHRCCCIFCCFLCWFLFCLIFFPLFQTYVQGYQLYISIQSFHVIFHQLKFPSFLFLFLKGKLLRACGGSGKKFQICTCCTWWSIGSLWDGACCKEQLNSPCHYRFRCSVSSYIFLNNNNVQTWNIDILLQIC